MLEIFRLVLDREAVRRLPTEGSKSLQFASINRACARCPEETRRNGLFTSRCVRTRNTIDTPNGECRDRVEKLDRRSHGAGDKLE